ncbi:MAG: MFS transporter [Dehalococcoidia bacterium]
MESREVNHVVREGVPVGPVRTTTAVTLCSVVAIMPVFFVGASGVFLREDLSFDKAGLGMAVAVFMASSAVFAVAGGRLSERIGAGNVLMVVGIGSGMVMLGVAVLADSLTHLVLLLALGGVSNSVVWPAGNLALARGVAVRPALMFGVRQAAIPVATLLAGASVPLVSLTLGWRWAFVFGALLSLGAAIFVPRQLAPAQARQATRVREGDAATGPLVAMAVALGVGTAAAVSLGSFLVEAAVAAGVAAGTAGWLLVAGSVAGIGARLFVGWLADRYRGWALYMVTVMLVLGAGGYGMLALGGPVLLTIGTLVAYGCGWGWTGLVMFAIVRLNPNAPAAATGIVSAGGASGAALGPLAFGYVAATASFQAAWGLAAIAALVAAGMVFAARAWVLHDRARLGTAG